MLPVPWRQRRIHQRNFPASGWPERRVHCQTTGSVQDGRAKSTAMADMASKLTPDEMLALGKYYQKMELPREEPKEPQLAGMGHYIFHNGNKFSGVPACVACHGQNAEGAANLPRLGGSLRRTWNTSSRCSTSGPYQRQRRDARGRISEWQVNRRRHDRRAGESVPVWTACVVARYSRSLTFFGSSL
jgi:cytochrome c553